jgi:hypothetical protein
VIISVVNHLLVDVRVGTVANPNVDVLAGGSAVLEFPAGTTQFRWVSKGATFSDGSRVPDDLVGATLPIASSVEITASVAGVRYFQPNISQLFAVDTLSFNLKSSSSSRCIGWQWGSTTGISWGYYALQSDSELEVFGGPGCSATRYLGKWTNAQLSGANQVTGERILSAGSAFRLKAITISPSAASVLVNSSTTLSASQFDELDRNIGNYFPLTWASSDTSVAAVSSAGVVNAKKVGTSSIKASRGTVEGLASLTVREPTPTSITVCTGTTASPLSSCSSWEFLSVNLSLGIAAYAFDGSTNITSQCSFTWSSSDVNKVTVTPNPDTRTAIINRKSSGATTITATCKGVSGVFNVRDTSG